MKHWSGQPAQRDPARPDCDAFRQPISRKVFRIRTWNFNKIFIHVFNLWYPNLELMSLIVSKLCCFWHCWNFVNFRQFIYHVLYIYRLGTHPELRSLVGWALLERGFPICPIFRIIHLQGKIYSKQYIFMIETVETVMLYQTLLISLFIIDLYILEKLV